MILASNIRRTLLALPFAALGLGVFAASAAASSCLGYSAGPPPQVIVAAQLGAPVKEFKVEFVDTKTGQAKAAVTVPAKQGTSPDGKPVSYAATEFGSDGSATGSTLRLAEATLKSGKVVTDNGPDLGASATFQGTDVNCSLAPEDAVTPAADANKDSGASTDKGEKQPASAEPASDSQANDKDSSDETGPGSLLLKLFAVMALGAGGMLVVKKLRDGREEDAIIDPTSVRGDYEHPIDDEDGKLTPESVKNFETFPDLPEEQAEQPAEEPDEVM